MAAAGALVCASCSAGHAAPEPPAPGTTTVPAPPSTTEPPPQYAPSPFAWDRSSSAALAMGGGAGTTLASIIAPTLNQPWMAVGTRISAAGLPVATAWTSPDARTWSGAPIVAGGMASSALASAQYRGETVVVGSVGAGANRQAAAWISSSPGAAFAPVSVPLTGGPSGMSLVAAGALGLFATGTVDGRLAVWSSTDGRLWQEQPGAEKVIITTGGAQVTALLAEGDTVYARGFKSPAQPGTHYNVVRVGDALRDPDDNRIVGYDGVFTGAGHITRGGDPATLVMTESARETEAGDKLFAGGIDVPLDFIPRSPKLPVTGRIMAVSDGVSVIGQYQVVVINRGARDGLAPGNVLAIFGAGPVVKDNANKGFLKSMTRLTSTRVQLPDERNGTFMVFKTFDNLSYGLIMEATDIIRVADRVQNP